MARLTAAARKKIPGKDFAGPDRSYPIEDASHARDALARSSGKSPALKKKVRGAVKRKFPGIAQKSGAKPKNRYDRDEVMKRPDME